MELSPYGEAGARLVGEDVFALIADMPDACVPQPNDGEATALLVGEDTVALIADTQGSRGRR